ncbi:ATP-binding protein [Chromatiaceae bacterium AAb-1]|nr:ATP-binding protein [Chromatiaceae bacterium AAb-1]
MTLPLLFEVLMLLTSVCALLLAGWLFWQGQHQPAMPALAGFAVMMALWCTGHIAILQQWPALGTALVLANPLMPMCFLHFAVRFVNHGMGYNKVLHRLERGLPWLYGATLAVILVSWWYQGGQVVSTGVFSSFFVFRGAGWMNLIYTVLLGIIAHAVLLYGCLQQRGNKRRSIIAVFIAGAWGLLLATSFVFPSLGLDWYPYPMLLLPSYVLLLVYGVVRYQVLEINAFANKALLWLVMVVVVLGLMALVSALLGQLGLQALADVPSWQLWLYSSLLLLLSAACYRPVSTMARRLIYPGVQLTEQLLDYWRKTLGQTESWPQLAEQAAVLISQQLGQPVSVTLENCRYGETTGLQIYCYPGETGWQFMLTGWEDVTPGYRLLGEVFGALLVSRCSILEQSLKLAEEERRRLDQQHLVELGALSAAMAHELRNPLNIIAMATAGTDQETRQHIRTQLQRADRLIADLLSYSGQLQLQYTEFPLLSLVQSIVQQQDWQGVKCELDIAGELLLEADMYRVQQVLVNLLDNALSFCRNQPQAVIRVEAQRNHSRLLLRIHNNGPEIPHSQLPQLFQPFVSKRSGGSGLGLAIVRRIMQAHQGQVSHRADLGWPVSFELHFPVDLQSR